MVERVEAETLGLVAEKSKVKNKIKKGKAKVFEVEEEEEEEVQEESEDEERDLLFQSLLSITDAYRRKYYNKPGLNNRRLASRCRGSGRSYQQNQQGYPPRNESQFVDRYAARKEEEVKEVVEMNAEKRGVDARTCFKCDKLGHIAKVCHSKITKVELLRKKLELVEKQEKGLVLLADDEEWLDYSDNERSTTNVLHGISG